jgi:hypothetical protein
MAQNEDQDPVICSASSYYRLLSIYEFGVICICRMLKSGYLFSMFESNTELLRNAELYMTDMDERLHNIS